jgi:hypothetical protein
MAPVKIRGLKLPPSLLAKKILCSAYLPSPFDKESRFRTQAFHANAMVRVIARLLKLGYNLRSVERGGNGFRIDLLFETPIGARTRLVEVKGSKQIREVHKIQAALYIHANVDADEIAVSNREVDEVLSEEFIEDVRKRAKATIVFLKNEPLRASVTYTKHPDACYTCANTDCPFLAEAVRPTPRVN